MTESFVEPKKMVLIVFMIGVFCHCETVPTAWQSSASILLEDPSTSLGMT